MKNIKVSLIMLFLILISSFSVESAVYLNANPFGEDGQSDGFTAFDGQQIKVNVTSTLNYVTTRVNVTATKARILNNYTQIIAVANITNNNASVWNQTVTFDTGQKYFVLIGIDYLTGWRRTYDDSPLTASYPAQAITLNYTQRCYQETDGGAINCLVSSFCSLGNISVTVGTTDSTPPSFSNLISTANNTYINNNADFNVTITEPNPDSYMLYWNLTNPAYSVASSGGYSGAGKAAVTKNLNLSFQDMYVCYYFWANDTFGNSAVSSTNCFLAKNNLSIVPYLLKKDYSRMNNYYVEEKQSFYISLNQSKNGVQFNTTCIMNASNITAHLPYGTANITLNASRLKYGEHITESAEPPTTLNYDIFTVYLCGDAPVSADVYINDTLFYNIPANIIPDCALNGTHEDIALFSNYKDKSDFNISVVCNGCTGTNKLKLIANNQTETLDFNRFMQVHGEDMLYNNTMNLNAYTGHQYRYEVNKTNIITFDCPMIDYNLTITSTPNFFNFNFLTLNGVPFVNASKLEATVNYDFLLEISGAYPESFYLNLTNASGKVLYSSGIEQFIINKSILNYDGQYILKAWAIDENGMTGEKIFSFNISDTTIPSIQFNFPSRFNISTAYVGNTYTSDIVLYDVNLYGYNYTIYYAGNQVYSSEVSGLTDVSYAVAVPFTYNFTGNYLHIMTDYDSHTDTSIPEFSVSKTNDTLTYDSISITAKNAIDTFTAKQPDRYNFKFIYPSAQSQYEYTIKSVYPITYLPNSKYPAHFVIWQEKKWLDFNGTSEKPLIYKVSDYEYKVTFQTQIIGKDNAVTYNSIGHLNEHTEAANVSVLIAPTDIYDSGIINGTRWFNTKAINAETTSGVLIYFFLLSLLICIVVISEISRIPALYILSSILGVIFSILIFTTISAVIGSVFCIVSIAYIIRAFQ